MVPERRGVVALPCSPPAGARAVRSSIGLAAEVAIFDARRRPLSRRDCLGLLLWPALGGVAGAQGQGATAATEPERRAARVIAVGPARAVKSLAQAARIAGNGDTLVVDAGDYTGDCAVWTQDRLTIRASGGRVRLLADGRHVEGKGIWVARGGDMRVEGFDFSGARVASRNGAGIRFERGRLVLRDCGFFDNENGILTAGDPAAELEIAGCEFAHNGFGDGYSHNLYVGPIGKLTVTGSYFHHARVGHLLKSRAAENHILYNRLTDEEGGRASYELEFPNGGVARVQGNIIEQGARTENPVLVSYGAEGYSARRNALYLVNNTLVDDRVEGGTFLAVKAGDRTLVAINNLLLGTASLESAGAGDYRNNLFIARGDCVDADGHDYRLRSSSAFVGRAVAVEAQGGVELALRMEYTHPRRTRPIAARVSQPGALQATGD